MKKWECIGPRQLGRKMDFAAVVRAVNGQRKVGEP